MNNDSPEDNIKDSPVKPTIKKPRNYFFSGGYQFTDEKPKPPKLAPIDRTTSNDNPLTKEVPPPPKLSI